MGNRAVITTPGKNLALCLHWNGGRDTVEPLLKYCELQGYRPPSQDCYGWARMAQVVGNFFGGLLSVGTERYRNLGDQGDNGVYVIDGWKIVDRYATDYDEDWNAVGLRHIDPSAEQSGYDFDEMLHAFDEAMPENLRLGAFLDAEEVPASDVRLGDKVWMSAYESNPELFEVVGFGADDAPGASRESPSSTATITTATTPGTATTTSTPTPVASPRARRNLQLRNDQGRGLAAPPTERTGT